ncbi:hypothetical protein MKW92_043374, partial [Papaver armeniacum]
ELPAIYCWEEFMSGVGSRNTGAPLYYKSHIQNGYPPWRNDDKDGYYVFVIRENLTLRCNAPSLQSAFCFFYFLSLFAFLTSVFLLQIKFSVKWVKVSAQYIFI